MDLRIRVMTPDDIPAGMRLKDLAGWNQTEADWRRFLQSNAEVCFVAEHAERITGTVATINYEDRFAWIGMVLVDPELRGRGIGTALLEHAIEFLEARGIPCLKLDATPEGRPIYERLGFQAEYEIERCVLERGRGASAGTGPADGTDLEDIESVLELDRKVFGADRSAVLRSLAIEASELVIVTRQSALVTGYGLGRKGSRADHLGPWVASSATTAREILDSFLERSRRQTVFVDVVKDSPWGPELLSQRGFVFSRRLTRMYRGVNSYTGRPELLCAILGPEFG